MDEQGFADFLRVCFPLLSSYALTSDVIARADWNPAVLMEWMAGEAKQLDLREELAAIRAPALVLAGEDDAWAPLESAQEVFELLPGHKQLPQLHAAATPSSATRPRPTRTCASSSTTSRRWRCA